MIFRFTIREILLLTVIVAMAVGWWLDHRQRNAILLQEKQANYNLQYIIDANANQLASFKSELKVAIQWIEAKKRMDALGLPWPAQSNNRLFGQSTRLHTDEDR